MLIRTAFEANEVDVAGTATDWAGFCHLLQNGTGDYRIGIESNASPWDCCLSILRIVRLSAGRVSVQPLREGVLEISGTTHGICILAENAREMMLANVNLHVHVDDLILPEVFTESSAAMVWTRSASNL